jgi:8-oxo-dGTP diphosphatase
MPEPRLAKRTYTYNFPRPAVTVDIVIFSMRASELVVLLVKRKAPPFEGEWALPGGFVEENESLSRACARELLEETGLSAVRFEQLGAFGDPGRDPRGHTVSIAFVTFIVSESAMLRAGDDAAEVAWHPLSHLSDLKPPVAGKRASRRIKLQLAFDHRYIIDFAEERLKERLHDPTRAAAFNLVPTHFTMSELQRVYEVVYAKPHDKRNFRTKILASGMTEPVAAARRGSHRPAQLYRWKLNPS